ncbi:sensor histidine kinase [Halomicroarcula sp. GCM10025709]|uniref:sensor histidine kinase n=1 Tax=Halomicroarcula sp. GCM10025709 TaxID=3252669 RepID=UPI0036166596
MSELASQVTLPVPADQTTRITLTVDGETRYYSLRTTPIEERDTAHRIGHSLLLRDVTPLERSRRRLEAKNDRLDQVAATVSHDLRNPLQVADGYTNVLAEELDDPELTGYVASISESHERMDEIIEDVLTLARQGDDMTEQEPLDFGAVVEAAWKNVETGTATLSVQGSGTVHADRTRLLTLLENLIRNSVEHGPAADDEPPDGDVSPVTVTAELFPGGFAVADDGPGVPADHATDVFEYGYTTSDDGTGLGLAIVRTVAHSHGWTVELDEDHDGARFVFGGVETTERT